MTTFDDPDTAAETVQYMYYTPRHPMRNNVREPLNPRIIVPLIGYPEKPAEMALTVPQAIELATLLMQAVQDFCKRWDVSDALRRTEPLPCPDVGRAGYGHTNGGAE